jgi:hypothetical protein
MREDEGALTNDFETMPDEEFLDRVQVVARLGGGVDFEYV